MNKSTHQALSSSVALLQSRFDFVLRALQPDIETPSTSAADPALLTKTQGESGSTSSPSILDSLLNMISSMAAPESPPETLETENKKTED